MLLACVAKLVDAHDSKSCGLGHVGSTPTTSTSDVFVRTIRALNINLFYFLIPLGILIHVSKYLGF